jgi:glucose/arabinose dehydrogenase
MRPIAIVALAALLVPAGIATAQQNTAQTSGQGGKATFGSWHDDMPGKRWHIKADDLPPPAPETSVRNTTKVVPKPANAQLKVPQGFEIRQLTSGLQGPRLMRVAPNGDIFVSESGAGRITVLRPAPDHSSVGTKEVFASGLNRPFGIAFYPANNPQWVYVANTDSVVRFPYAAGTMKATGQAQVVVPKLPSGKGHWTRDVVFSNDGARMFVSVGSGSNVGDTMGKLDPAALEKWKQEKPLGATWGDETDRADVLVFDPQGKNQKVHATGIRNCVGMAVNPTSGDVWCSTNERDALGDNLVPDIITSVKEGAFYGWPWYYIGNHEDPRLRGARPDLKDKVTVPDILVQAHSAALQMMFYTGNQFPAEYNGNVFAALHGSWNRATRTGYKIIRGIVKDGKATGEYEDFVTGFVVDDASVWGRPVGVAQLGDGSLIFSEDGNGTVWRVSRSARATSR